MSVDNTGTVTTSPASTQSSTIMLFRGTNTVAIPNFTLSTIPNTFYGSLYYSQGNVSDGLNYSKTICRDSENCFYLNAVGLYKFKLVVIIENNPTGIRYLQLRNYLGDFLCGEGLISSATSTTLNISCIYNVTSANTEWVQPELLQSSGVSQNLDFTVGYVSVSKIN